MIVNIEDLRNAARKRLPRMIFDYVDGGSDDEQTLQANRTDFKKIGLKQTVLMDLSETDFSTTILGQKMSMPLMVAPTGFTGLLASRGEAQAARAACKADIPFIQSTMSICPLEEVREAMDRPQWFQLYVFKDRSIVQGLMDRLKEIDCPVLILTVDCTIMGRRERDARNGFIASDRLSFKGAMDIARHPRWALDMWRGRPLVFGNLTDLPGIGKDIFQQGHFASRQQDLCLSWKDIAWVRSMWPGKILIKGIMTKEDALEAKRQGVDGIIVSNHGGRQLDGAASSIAALPEIVNAVGDELDVLFDGGIRRGSDMVKAIALGAKACLIGRAMLYGLGADGGRGVSRALDILRHEFRLTANLMGLTRYDQLHGKRDRLIIRE